MAWKSPIALEEDRRLHGAVHARASGNEDGGQVLQHSLGLHLDIALDLVRLRVARDLASSEDEPARLDRLRVRAGSGRRVLRGYRVFRGRCSDEQRSGNERREHVLHGDPPWRGSIALLGEEGRAPLFLVAESKERRNRQPIARSIFGPPVRKNLMTSAAPITMKAIFKTAV
jgi:hypothetical protein